MKNTNLAIAIPTFNRAEIVKENFLLMIDEIRKFSVPIYFSDDSSDDETQKFFLDLHNRYPYTYYRRNKPSLGHDKNCISTLMYPEEDYIWYLGDAKIIQPGGIERVLMHINKYSPSFIAINSIGRDLKIENKLYIDGNILLKDLGWHLTLTGATIYSKNLVNQIKLSDISKYSNFPQFAIIFNGFAAGNCNLYWDNEKLIDNNIHNMKSYWWKNPFKTFITDWTSCVNNLDNMFLTENKEIATVSHSIRTGVFNFRSLLRYRYKGSFGYGEYIQYFEMLKKHSNVSIFIIAIIAIIPRFILSGVMLSRNKNSVLF
jgi:hypothetical protein